MGRPPPSRRGQAPGEGGGLPHLARGKVAVATGGALAKGLSCGWVSCWAPCTKGNAHWKAGVSGLCSRPCWPLCRPLNVPGSFPLQASASALALPGAGTPCPRAVPRAAPSRPPTLAQQPPPWWALPCLHPGQGPHSPAASLSPEDWSLSAVVAQMTAVSAPTWPYADESRERPGLSFFFPGRILVP